MKKGNNRDSFEGEKIYRLSYSFKSQKELHQVEKFYFFPDYEEESDFCYTSKPFLFRRETITSSSLATDKIEPGLVMEWYNQVPVKLTQAEMNQKFDVIASVFVIPHESRFDEEIFRKICFDQSGIYQQGFVPVEMTLAIAKMFDEEKGFFK